MTSEDDVRYRALTARDVRFDGLFFVGVTSTGIYCRPVCTAKTPGRARCRFFDSATLAELAGYRPCLRCRPELAPGKAPIDRGRTIAWAAAARIESGALDHGGSLDELAASLGVSSRQLRRTVKQELGATPVELAQTNRLLLAKRLIAETSLSLTQVAFAAGFDSVRRFNSLFRDRYRLTPGELRRGSTPEAPDDCLRLTLAYRPPYAWDRLLRFLETHATTGVECVADDAYHRTVAIGGLRGWLSVSRSPTGHRLQVELSASLAPASASILARLRSLFDLDARPDVIDGCLALDPTLAPRVARLPGLRVPGAFDAFELAARTVLGQQVSVRGATTLAGRLADRFGEPIVTPRPCLNRVTPTAEALARVDASAIAEIGLPRRRAETMRGLAVAFASRHVDLEPNVDPSQTARKLVELPGIGPWTAQYVAMRALRWPDAFPAGDLALAKATGARSAKELEARSDSWRPWRAYAVMHLWESLSDGPIGEPRS